MDVTGHVNNVLVGTVLGIIGDDIVPVVVLDFFGVFLVVVDIFVRL